MHKYLKIGAAGSIVALIFTATTALAHTQTPTAQIETQSPKVEGQQSVNNKLNIVRQRYQRERKNFRSNEGSTTSSRSDRVTRLRERTQQFRKNHLGSTTREEVRSRIKTFEGQNKERVAHRRERVQQHLNAIENKVKERLVERLTKRFAYVNKAWTTHFSNRLDRYAAILQKIQDRADSEAASGKDVTTVDASINLAQVAIQDAHTAIATQKDKTYVLDLSSVSTTTATATSTPAGQARIMQGFRTAFQSMRNQLFSDLSGLRSVSMVKVRTSVLTALQTLKEGRGSTATSPTSSSTASVN